MPKKRNVELTKPDYVTRDMLAALRDELEDLFDTSNATIDRAERALQDDTSDICAEFENIQIRLAALESSVQKMRGLLGLKHVPRRKLTEPVPWSYFHVWIARINAAAGAARARSEVPVGSRSGRKEATFN